MVVPVSAEYTYCNNHCHSNRLLTTCRYLEQPLTEVIRAYILVCIVIRFTLHHPRQSCLCRRVVMATILFMICIFLLLQINHWNSEFVCRKTALWKCHQIFCALFVNELVCFTLTFAWGLIWFPCIISDLFASFHFGRYFFVHKLLAFFPLPSQQYSTCHYEQHSFATGV